MTHNDKISAEQARKVANHMKQRAKGKQRQRFSEERKKQRRNLKPKGRSDKKLTPDAIDQWDDLGYEGFERIMPRDEGERRRAVEQAAFRMPEHAAANGAREIPTGAKLGLVVSVSSGLCQVEMDGRALQCSIRGSLTSERTGFTNALAVGDEVAVRENGAGGGVIEAVLPRRSVLARPDVFSSHLRQILVANAEQLLIVSSWREPVIWLELIDRYLIAAERSELRPIVCVNKVDLVEDEAEFEEALRPYNALGYRVIRTSARSGEGIGELREALRERMTVLTGMSGTGKSSLISAAQPGLNLRTSDVSDWSGEGRHTTMQATLLRLEIGGAVIDTPGIREFGLSGLRRHELAQFFPEIASFAMNCRFSNCSHMSEPGCAALEGEASGGVPRSRYHSYRLIYESLPA